MALCDTTGALDEAIVEVYGEMVSSALLIIDRVVLDPPSASGASPTRVLRPCDSPSRCRPGLGPHPVAGDDPQLDGAAERKAERRLAEHWQGHGFVELPGSHGLHVARGDDLIVDDDL